MSKRSVLLVGTGLLVLYWPYSHLKSLPSTAAWRYEVAKTYAKNVINPIGDVPTAVPNQTSTKASASLEELNLSPVHGLERRTILELGQCNWIPARQNIIVLGPTGSGKTFLACAFGKAPARSGFTVRYHRTSRLLHTLSQVRSDGSLTNILRSLAKCSLLVLDDWMRDAISIQDAQNILEVLDDRFGHTATLIATQ